MFLELTEDKCEATIRQPDMSELQSHQENEEKCMQCFAKRIATMFEQNRHTNELNICDRPVRDLFGTYEKSQNYGGPTNSTITHNLLPITYYLSPTAYYLLPTTCYLLPIK